MKSFPALAAAISMPTLLLLVVYRSKKTVPKNNTVADNSNDGIPQKSTGNLKGQQYNWQAQYYGDYEHYNPTIPVPPVPGFESLSREDWPEELRHASLLAGDDGDDRTDDDESLHDRLSESSSLKHSPKGKFANLVLLLRFSDHEERKLPTQQEISRLYNSEDTPLDDRAALAKNAGKDDITPTGSVRQVYFANSHSTFTVETTVIDWITLPNTEKYYADNEYGLSKSKFKEAMKEALNVLDADSSDGGFDFGSFDLDGNGALDGFGVLHSGYGAEFSGKDCNDVANADRIWSHKGGLKDWTSSDGTVKTDKYYVSSALRGKCNANIVRMGVLCHELGHYLGLPDLYDSTFDGNGLGAYDFMSQSWGFDGSGLYPPNLSAWSKVALGWATAELIESDGVYALEASLIASPLRVYKIAHNFPEKEYILLEVRQPFEYDTKIPQGGIAVYHIDENAKGQKKRGFPTQDGWPENGNHYKVALLPADGSYDLEQGENQGSAGDLWHAGSVLKELNPSSVIFPSTDTYEDGSVKSTGIRIFDFSESGDVMTFKVEGFLTQQAVPTRSE